MSNAFALPRRLILFGTIIPVAAILGYLLATPTDFGSVVWVGLLVCVLLLPLVLRWHHLLLIVGWNATINLFFLPGQPELWMLLAVISLFFSSLDRLLSKRNPHTYVRSVVWPLAFLILVVVATAIVAGGIGVQALGSSTIGGKRYIYVLIAILGYFALANQRIPPQRARLYLSLFFLSALTAMVSNLAFFGGPAFYFLYYVFPAAMAMEQAVAEFSVQSTGLVRLTGLMFAGPAITYALLLLFGIQGVLAIKRPWRFILFLIAFVAGLLGGFRSSVVMAGLLFAILFYFEGLFRTRLMLAVLVTIIFLGVGLVLTSRSLPISIQRSLSFLPIDVDPNARADAQGSTEWRLRMWKVLLPEVPRYFWIGKGFAVNPTDLYLLQEAQRQGLTQDIDVTIAGGSYHSGPLTLILPFGIFGVIAFLWFAVASLRILYQNNRFSSPELKRINTFLLCYFAMRFVYFVLFYGHFAEDLAVFTGIIGLSVSLNGGARSEADVINTPSPLMLTKVAN